MCKSLAHSVANSNISLHSHNGSVDDTESSCNTTDQEYSLERRDRTSTAPRNPLQCPDCNHAPFGRRQELIRHFARHDETENTCEDCHTEFSKVSKYLWHRCAADKVNHQAAYKKRWQLLREDVEMALDRACGIANPRKRRAEHQTKQRQKRKAALVDECLTTATTIHFSPSPQDGCTPSAEREATADLSAPRPMSCTLVPVTGRHIQPNEPAGASVSSPQTNQVVDNPSEFWTTPSDAPVIWDNWNWLANDLWVPNNQNQTTNLW